MSVHRSNSSRVRTLRDLKRTARAAHEHVHDHVNVHDDVHVIVEMIGFYDRSAKRRMKAIASGRTPQNKLGKA